MLIGQVLSSDAVLNHFDVIETLSFIPGEETTLVLRLLQSQRHDHLRYVADLTATLTVHLANTDGTQLTLAMTPMTGDYSIWSATLTEAQTAELLGGNFTFDLVTGTKTVKGWVQNGLSMIVTGACDC